MSRASRPLKNRKIGDINFKLPKEAPTFHPSPEEFKDPLLYISKIRPVAENFGICKIKPPPDWQPPFTLNVEEFKFTPRVQKLNELEAQTRIKLNYLDQIGKFWELQGSTMKLPIFENTIIDVYSLHEKVKSAGGSEAVTLGRKWGDIATKLEKPTNRVSGGYLKQYYEQVLHPYDVFQDRKNKSSINLESVKIEIKTEDDKVSVENKSPQKLREKKSRSYSSSESEDEKSAIETVPHCRELTRLQIHGAGPKMAGFELKRGKTKQKTRGKKQKIIFDPLAKYTCHVCSKDDIEESLLLCDKCDDCYHFQCLKPSLPESPKGSWRCPSCLAEEVSKPVEAFGFEQAQREYTLQEFGEMADQFKCDYFNMPVHLVPLSLVEKEFWRIVSTIDENVTVEYGADLHTMDHGSGFPTNISQLDNKDEDYRTSGWNLNNMPALEGSVLRYLNADISGMKIPWMYVGMCFATFCWHNEDHWSYSINYLHWGEPKTWYGVAGSKAEKFEEEMKKIVPELFHTQPDLLHQLVTIMNPNILMDAGVPVFRADQHAGEFVVTFPRAYHAGFNQGYNFAEAVNFAPPDWLPIGRDCMSHYSTLKRYCVFSHDELICRMSYIAESLRLDIAASTYEDMINMVKTEKEQRKMLLNWGCCAAEQKMFELISDDERQCDICKTTCFLSAVTCSCNNNKLACLKHFEQLCNICSPENITLCYRYTLDKLSNMLFKLKVRAESFDEWLDNVKGVLNVDSSSKADLEVFKKLLAEGKRKKFPESSLMKLLSEIVNEGEKCVAVIQLLRSEKIKLKEQEEVLPKLNLSYEDLKTFYDQVLGLPCSVKDLPALKDFIDSVEKFKRKAEQSLVKDLPVLEKIA